MAEDNVTNQNTTDIDQRYKFLLIVKQNVQ